MQRMLVRNFTADGAIAAYKLVAASATAGQVTQANASTATKVIGTSGQVGMATAAGERQDVTMMGIDKVVAGGTIAMWDPITSDANGNAVKATPAAGTNANIVGFAYEAAAFGDIFRVVINPSIMQG